MDSENHSKIVRNQPIQGINAVPIVDIFLVLLIIFMVSAPSLYLKKNQLLVSLPQSQLSQPTQNSSKLDIQLLFDGTIYFDKQVLSKEAWLTIMKKNLNQFNEVVVNADKNTSHGKVIDVISELRQIGYQKIYIGVRR